MLATAIALLVLHVESVRSAAGIPSRTGSTTNGNSAELGKLYLHRGITQGKEGHYTVARRFLRKAAKLGDIAAMDKLGSIYAKGEGVVVSFRQAGVWYRKAAAAGDAAAMLQLGMFYEGGCGVKRNAEAAARWYAHAAGYYGDEHALRRLAILWKSKRFALAAKKGSLHWLQTQAASGRVPAMFAMGWFREHGCFGPVDYQRAMVWYHRAAGEGDWIAMMEIARSYLVGQGVKKDIRTALIWYRRAAATGAPLAERYMWALHVAGYFGRRDPAKIIFWVKRAAAGGDGESMLELGITYAYGRDGVRKNPLRANRWLIRSALAGWPDAVSTLAQLYNVSPIHR